MATVTEQPPGTFAVVLTVAEVVTLDRERDLRGKGQPVPAVDVMQDFVEGRLGERAAKHGDLRASQLEAGFKGLSVADKAKVKALIPGVD